jgi:hypothetical protein
MDSRKAGSYQVDGSDHVIELDYYSALLPVEAPEADIWAAQDLGSS